VRVGDLTVRFRVAGHILGASQLAVDVDGSRIHFTGDLGRVDDPLMRPPSPLEETDALVCESTYGNRSHSHVDPGAALAEIVNKICRTNGVVILPAFAVGRAETLLLQLSRLKAADAIPDVPIFLNSPMAVDASVIYAEHPEEHRIDDEEFASMYGTATLVRTVDESKLLNLRGGPAIIISASGMLEGGRVLHHIAAYGTDPRNAIVLTGFQAGGTRGARLQRGERVLRIFGHDVPIRAHVYSLEMLSAHADAAQIVEWLKTAPRAPAVTFLNHGEPDAADALRLRIERTLGWAVKTPQFGDLYSLGAIQRGAETAAVVPAASSSIESEEMS
jgi:metallo-beta-lactamase family protein